jgi:hypothetical protein
MELRLTNYKDRINVECIGNPPTGDWRMVKENGERKIVRDLRVQRNFIIEDFIRYVKKDFLEEYKRILESVGNKNKKKFTDKNIGDMYINRGVNNYYVRIKGRHIGSSMDKEEARRIRDKEIQRLLQEEAA